MTFQQHLATLLFVVMVVGCKSRDRRDQDFLNIAYRGNQHQQNRVLRTTPNPPPPKVDGLTPADAEYGVEDARRSITLQEAIEIALSNPNTTRVTRGGTVAVSPGTFYDVEISEEQLRAALAAFDTRFESELYTNQFKNPPDSFFGPGLSQSDAQDVAAFTTGLFKPLGHGGVLSASYNPSPGYFFEPNSTSTGFNPRYISELEFSLRQPLLRNAGLQVNVAPLQVAQLQVEQSAWDFKLSLIDSVQSVAEAYWDLYAARVAVDEYEDVIPLLEEIVRIQEESFEADLVIASDVARSRAQLYEYEQDLLRLQSEVVSRELRLKNLLNLPPTGGETLPVTVPTTRRVKTTLNESYLLAMDSRPEIVRQRLNVSIRQLEVLVADNQRKPDLDFTALYRLNGLGESLGDALEQMAEVEFTDIELGLTLSMPIGLRQKTAAAQASRLRLARDRRLLEQELFSVSHEIAEASQSIDFAFREYEKAKLRLESASEWGRGARLRYMNPAPDSSDSNWMLQYLDDYYRALRNRTDAAIEVAAALNRYNVELVRYEQTKGTLLDFFAIDYCGDPCRQAAKLSKSSAERQPILVTSHPIDQHSEFAENATADNSKRSGKNSDGDTSARLSNDDLSTPRREWPTTSMPIELKLQP